MKILMIDKYYFVKGGVERYLFELKSLLEARGHEIIPFSMQHPRNAPSAWAEYFVDMIDYDNLGFRRHPKKSIQAAGRLLYSFQAKRRLEQLLTEAKPDVAHLHMIDHQISPSVLHTLKKHRVPVFQTVHQYKLVCPNYRLYIEQKGEICERCLKGCYLNAFVQKCHKNSAGASLLVAFEAYLHKMLHIYGIIDRFHVPSRFIGRKLVEGGIEADKIGHHFLTLNMDDYPYRRQNDGYVLYYGRLSAEKGLFTLLRAFKAVRSGTRLLLAGDGPARQNLERFVAEEKIEGVSFLGYRSGEELRDILGGAAFVVVPSEWYENSPFVIYEPFCMGKPVIGAEIGGIPEFIEPQKNGLLFTPGDEKELTACMDQLLNDPEATARMGESARAFAEANFDPDSHCSWLIHEYEALITHYSRGL